MATPNIYKVYVDTTDDDVAVWTMEATCPASAIKKVLSRVSFGKSAKMESFEISAELEVRNMTYAEYKSRRTPRAPDAGGGNEADELQPPAQVA